MPSDKNIFIPQMVFNVQGAPVLSGILKSGQLKNNMVVQIDQKKLKIIKIDQSPMSTGISLEGLDINKAQDLMNKELEFYIPEK